MSVSDKRIYLASRSPRRRDLLKQVGVPFELLLLREDLRRGADVDERRAGRVTGVYALMQRPGEMAVRHIAYRGLPQNPRSRLPPWCSTGGLASRGLRHARATARALRREPVLSTSGPMKSI